MASGVLDVTGLSIKRGQSLILDDATFDIGPGVTVLLGSNGAGKTSLLRVLATVDTARAGTITFGDAPLRKRQNEERYRRHLGYLPQNFTWHPHFSVRDMVTYIGLMRGVPSNHIDQKVNEALHKVDLADTASAKLATLSGGMLRRAGIAQAIVNNPSILLLDEPTAGLDPRQRAEFRSLLAELGEAASVVISTHLIEDIVLAASRILVLDGQQLVFDGTPVEMTEIGESDHVTAQALEQAFTVLTRVRPS